MWLSFTNNPLLLGLLLTLALAVCTDLSIRKIPNMLILFGLMVSLLGQVFWIEGAGWLNWLAGVALGCAAFMPMYLARGMAAGDVKLMMVVGGFLGYPLIITALVSTYIAGGLIAMIYVVFKGQISLLLQNLRAMLYGFFIKITTGVSVENTVLHNSVGHMPYALAIALGTVITLYLRYADNML